MNLLLIEDHPGDIVLYREALGEILEQSYHLEIARDGAGALSCLDQITESNTYPKPDLIFLDFNLPKVHGKEVLEIHQNTSFSGRYSCNCIFDFIIRA